MSHVQIADATFALDEVKRGTVTAGEACERAYLEPGHAFCMCTVPPQKMQIRLRNAKYHLAVWPEGGERHDPSCDYYRQTAADLSVDETERAVREIDEGYALRLGFALEQSRVIKSREGGTRQPRDRDQSSGQTLTLEQTLHFLWTQADMNRWRNGWHRDWRFVESKITRLAASTQIGSRCLGDYLFVVPHFTQQRKDLVREAWATFRGGLASDADTVVKVPLVLGELRSIERVGTHSILSLTHTFERIYCDQEIYAQLLRQYPYLEARVGATELHHDQDRVVLLLRIRVMDGQRMDVVGAAAMPVNAKWIPAWSAAESHLATMLIAQGRTFRRLLSRTGLDVPQYELQDVYPNLLMYVGSLIPGQHPDDVCRWDWDGQLPMKPVPNTNSSEQNRLTSQVASGTV
jgi:hypothetical protein